MKIFLSFFFLVYIFFLSACNTVGSNSHITALEKNEKLVVGKVIYLDDNNKTFSAAIFPCFVQNMKEICVTTRFNNFAASLRSLSEKDMDYIVLKVEHEKLLLSNIKLHNIKGTTDIATSVFDDGIDINVSNNYDVTYIGSIYMTNDKIITIVDELDEFLPILKNINSTGKEWSIAKNIMQPKSIKVKTTFSKAPSGSGSVIIIR